MFASELCSGAGEQGTEVCSLRCRVRALVAPALALAAAAASLAGAPPAGSGGFAGNGRRFRHGSWTSVRFSAGVVRRRLSRLGETLTLGGVSG